MLSILHSKIQCPQCIANYDMKNTTTNDKQIQLQQEIREGGIKFSGKVQETVRFKTIQLVGWLGFNGILSTQVAAISCLRKFKVC